jgi:hypothetical protein
MLTLALEGYSATTHTPLAFKGLKRPGTTREHASQTLLTDSELVIRNGGLSEGQRADLVPRAIISFVCRRTSIDTESGEQPQPSVSSVETRPWRKKLMSEVRYLYLFWLWYAMMFAIGFDILLLFPGRFAMVPWRDLRSPTFFRDNVIYYAEWIAIDIAIMLSACLCFAENIPWSRFKLYCPFAHIVWTFLDIIFFGCSALFSVSTYVTVVST